MVFTYILSAPTGDENDLYRTNSLVHHYVVLIAVVRCRRCLIIFMEMLGEGLARCKEGSGEE